MSEWTVPVRNVLFLALPRRAFLLPASLCTRFLGTCFLAGFILVAIGAALLVAPSPASCAAANTQYTVILARAWDCVRLLSALRADATAKKMQIRRRCRFEQVHLSGRAKMQRRAFLMRAGAGVAATAVARPAIAQTGAPVRWRLATSWPKSLDTLYGSVEAMCQRVGQLT